MASAERGHIALRTSIDIAIRATIDIKSDIFVDGSEVGAAVDLLNIIVTTVDSQCSTGARSDVTAAEEATDDVFASAATLRIDIVDTEVDSTNSAIDIGTAENGVDEATVDACGGCAGDIGLTFLPIATAEEAVDTATIDHEVVVLGTGSIATAEEVLDGILLAVVDGDIGGAIGRIRSMGGQVATAVDGTEGIGLR